MPRRTPWIRCVGCHRPAETDWLSVSVEASEGPRTREDGEQFWSALRTMTRGAVLCHDCLKLPEWAGLVGLISHWSAEPAIQTGYCVILCHGRGPGFLRRIMPRSIVLWPGSGAYNCPACHHKARAWNAATPPPGVREMALETATRRRNVWRWVADMAATIYYGPEPEECTDEIETATRQAIETGREGP
jgi:hypothetical protein